MRQRLGMRLIVVAVAVAAVVVAVAASVVSVMEGCWTTPRGEGDRAIDLRLDCS